MDELIPSINDRFSHYTLTGLIRKTHNSFIFSALNENNGQKVVIKFIYIKPKNQQQNIDNINTENDDNGDNDDDGVPTEIKLWREIDCPYIVKLLDSFKCPNMGFYCAVMPFCEGGDLNEHILKNVNSKISNSVKNKGIDEDIARNIVHDILLALKYLHDKCHIVHRDIKTENILLVGEDEVYLTDMGLSTKYDDKKLLTEYTGTLAFSPPEIINHQPYDNSIDIWSLGITLFHLLSGVHPFPLSPECALRRCITKAAFFFPAAQWKNISKSAKDLIDKMIKADPSKRISVDDALKHPWMDSMPEKMTRKISIGTEINRATDLFQFETSV